MILWAAADTADSAPEYPSVKAHRLGSLATLAHAQVAYLGLQQPPPKPQPLRSSADIKHMSERMQCPNR